MDILTGWDFDKGEDRRRAVKYVLTEKPKLVIGSPMCTLFSLLQEINIAKHGHDPEWMEAFQKRLDKAKRHIRFCIQLYKLQMSQGRYWLHEHPWSARSWRMPEMEQLAADPRSIKVKADMCQFGLRSPIAKGGIETGPALTPTGFMGNSWRIMERLGKRCD